jgi:uncharacterized phage-associated protein
MATALNVARYLVRLAAAEDEPEYLCPLRVQKLLYYVQGWSLGLRGKPVFAERIEAWANGPVVPNVYQAFKKYGARPIPEDVPEAVGLDAKDKEVTEAVWNAYKQYSAISLRNMTHGEAPWKDARGDAGPAERRTTEITKKALRAFFGEDRG